MSNNRYGVLAGVVMLASLVGGCGLTAEQIAAIQARAKQYCGFVPTLVQITDLSVPEAADTTDLVGMVAQAICGAVTSKTARRGAGGERTVTITTPYGSAVVTGHFARRSHGRR